MKILTLDTETSGLPKFGLDYKTNFEIYPNIVSLAFKINDDVTKEFIINQEGVPIPPEATAIHGITDEMCAASPHTLISVLGAVLDEGQGRDFTLGHNFNFDTSMVKANVLKKLKAGIIYEEFYKKIEELLVKERRICTMMSTIKFCNIIGPRGAKWPKLIELFNILFPGETFDAHRAGADVDVTKRCFNKLLEIGIITLPEVEGVQ